MAQLERMSIGRMHYVREEVNQKKVNSKKLEYFGLLLFFSIVKSCFVKHSMKKAPLGELFVELKLKKKALLVKWSHAKRGLNHTKVWCDCSGKSCHGLSYDSCGIF